MEISYSRARAMFASLLDKATSNREAITITRRGKEPVALIPESELRGLRETIHLLRSRVNAERLIEAITDTKAGRNLEKIDIENLRKRIEKAARNSK